MHKRILVIDDDDHMLAALDLFLTDEQFEVKTVNKSEKIDDAIMYFNPALIILDIQLHNSDGRVICNDLKFNLKTAHLPIILLTALSHKEIAFIDCQADAIIGKPFESSSLLSTIKQLLN